ncbi:DUF6383 domain-containing protein [Parabacteroides gordonii]|jgi:hypothetical protein|uniref:DUF6383 domain-containing protein n=1 Tax=Parabacteroides gordonii TaxID=574930 RepID=UPI00241FCC82|nr:DUF6383 domain-containing protein [Parabacteroides gordonii]
MNKKFSTLVASVLLAGAMGTVDAADYAMFTTAPTAAEVVKAGNFYQLETATAGTVLGMFRNTTTNQYELRTVAAASGSTDELRSTLWTIMSQENAEGGYSYVFVNYASGLQLAINSQGAAVVKHPTTAGTISAPTANITVGGDVAVWKWVSAPDPISKSFTETTLSAAFGEKRDSVLVLTAAAGGFVGAEKYALKNLPTDVTTSTNYLKIKPASPAAVLLGVDDLNSMLWKGDATGKMKLTFTKDVEGGNPEAVNLFTNQAYKAVAAVGYPFNNYDVPATGAISATALTTTDLVAYENAQHLATLAQAVRAALGTTDAEVAANAPIALAFAQALGAVTTTDIATVVSGIEGVSNIEADEDKVAVEEAVRAAVLAYINTESYRGDAAAATILGEAVSTSTTGVANVISAASVTTVATADAAVKTYTDDVTAKAALAAAEKTSTATVDAIAANGWISLKADDGKYLMLDTAYLTSQAGNKHLKFSLKQFADINENSNGGYLAPTNKTRLDLAGRYNFQFVWFPAQDSISIRTAGYAKLEDDDNTTKPAYFRDLVLTAGTNYKAPTITNHAAASATGNAEQNLVKIAVLTNNHREVTVGNSEFAAENNYTINTKITLNAGSQYELTTLPSGVYFFNLSTGVAAKKYDNGKYYVAKFCGNNNNTDYEAEETTQLYGVAQDFGHMPRTQWVVVQNPGVAGQQTVNIYNREFPTMKYENIQLYKGGDKKVFTMFGFPTISVGDTLSYALAADVKPLAGVLTDSYLGYYKPEDENQFKLNRMTMDYFSGIQLGNFVDVAPTANDTTVRVDVKGNKATFQLVPSADAKYGYEGSVAPQLYRRYYTIKVYDGNKLVNDAKWIARDEANENTYKVTANAAEAVKFYLKENNQIVTEEGDTLCYHALVDFDNAARVGVRDGSLKFSIEGVCSEERVATFHVDYDQSIIYRELKGNETTAVAEGVEPFSAPCVANFFRARIADKQYLFESANQAQFNETGKGINFLGVRYEGGQFNDSTAMYVDTADVRNPYRPQYMLAVGVEKIAEGKWCPIHGTECKDEHKIDVPAHVWGRYLINAQDSLANAVNGAAYQWENQYTRLAFVHAMHCNDTLVVFKNGKYPLTSEGAKDFKTAVEWARAAAANTVTPNENDYVYVMNVKDRNGNNATKAFAQDYANYKFMFRLVDDKDTRDFIIESHDNAWGLDNDTYTAGENENEYRAIKVQNGVPVIARFASASEGMLNAEWWNIDERCTTPTANEGIEASEVSVVAANGAVIIKGAAGKNVVITNVLGQTIANTVLSSDNATIAAPAGVVVVAVEGEAAVKAIVK